MKNQRRRYEATSIKSKIAPYDFYLTHLTQNI